MYIHEYPTWPNFTWDNDKIALLLDEACHEQGHLFGRLSNLGFDDKLMALAENLAHDVVESSEIEGIHLNTEDVRSSIARRLGIESIKQSGVASHYIDGVVAVMIEAMEQYDMELTKEKLCAWQSAFFPTGYSDGVKIEVGQYRTHEEHVVSGFLGRERIHYIAPSPNRIEDEMARFIQWFNSKQDISPIVRSAIVHLWFVSIHPFEDGNGRLARILSDMYLARSDKSALRFYNISSVINREKNHYYKVMERVQHGNGDITEWLNWYLQVLIEAIKDANAMSNTVLNKSFFWMRAAGMQLNMRQRNTLNLFLDGYEAKLTSKTWASLNKCSRDTALRDIKDLVNKGVLRQDIPDTKRPSYSIVYGKEGISSKFSKIKLIKDDDNYYLTGLTMDGIEIHERVLALDADRYFRNDLPLDNIIEKYCSYLIGK